MNDLTAIGVVKGLLNLAAASRKIFPLPASIRPASPSTATRPSPPSMYIARLSAKWRQMLCTTFRRRRPTRARISDRSRTGSGRFFRASAPTETPLVGRLAEHRMVWNVCACGLGKTVITIVSRRKFLKQMRWAPVLFLPASIRRSLLRQLRYEHCRRQAAHFPFADVRLHSALSSEALRWTRSASGRSRSG